MSIETRPPIESSGKSEFVRCLNQAEEECLKLHDTIGNLDSVNRETIQELLKAVERLIVAEGTKVVYPEKFNPSPAAALDHVENALSRLRAHSAGN